MQIDSSLPQTLASTSRAPMMSDPDADDDATGQSDAPKSHAASSPSQDDAVRISAAGVKAAAQDSRASQDGSGSGADAGSGADPNPSTVKSFAYGSLGLERPDQPQSDTNPGYTAGRWVAAGITIAGLVALLF